MRVGVFHPGSQNSWQRATAFQEAGTLAWYATSVHFPADGLAMRLARRMPGRLGRTLVRELGRRGFPLLQRHHLRILGVSEWIELALRRVGWIALAERVNVSGNRRFARQVARLAEREPVEVLWGYNGASLCAFRRMKPKGIRCVLDQSIGHPAAENAMLLAEQERHPEFFAAFRQPHSRAWIECNDEEARLAELVVCGSRFAAETMAANGCDPEKLRVVPYGYDETLFPDSFPERAPLEGRPLELLFVGSLQPRKGVAYLLKAIQEVPPELARLTLIGRLDVPEATFRRYRARVRHLGQVPRQEVVAHYRAADCFVLPSLFEGSAVVLNEAMAAGLGIIQSRAAGDGATDGENGILLERVTVEGLRDAILAAARDPARVAAWQRASWARRKTRTWARYRANVRAMLES